MVAAIASVVVLLIIRVLLSFITANFVLSSYGSNAFVNFGNIQSLGQIVQLLGSFGQNTTLLRKNDNLQGGLEKNLKSAIQTIVTFMPASIFLTALFVFYNPMMMLGRNLDDLLLLSGFFISILFVTLLIACMSSIGKSSVGQLLSLTVGSLFLLALWVTPQSDISDFGITSVYMSSWIAAASLFAIFCCVYFRGYIASFFYDIPFKGGIQKHRIVEGVTLMLTPAASVLAIYAVRLILNDYLAVDLVAQWQIAVMISGLVSLFTGTVMSHIFMPSYANALGERVRSKMVNSFVLAVFSTVIVLIPIVFHFEFFLAILFPSLLAPELIFFKIWIVAEWVRVINWVYSTTLIANKKENLVLYLDWSTNLIFVLALFIVADKLNLLLISGIYFFLCTACLVINVVISKMFKLT